MTYKYLVKAQYIVEDGSDFQTTWRSYACSTIKEARIVRKQMLRGIEFGLPSVVLGRRTKLDIRMYPTIFLEATGEEVF
jgi:hypothetical protein